VPARNLESLLEALARIDFPINPRIFHDPGNLATVEFPAYDNRLDEVRHALAAFGFDPQSLRITGMLEAIRQKTGLRDGDRG
jgi:hypothetical protein